MADGIAIFFGSKHCKMQNRKAFAYNCDANKDHTTPTILPFCKKKTKQGLFKENYHARSAL